MRRAVLFIFAFLLMPAFAVPVDAEMYKWKDEEGHWHFTDDAGKVPRDHNPGSRNFLPAPQSSPPAKMKRDPGSPLNKKSAVSPDSQVRDLQEGMEEGFQKMGEALGKGLEEGMQKMGEELGKAFEGIGELMVIAEQNKPDEERKMFDSKEEQVRYDVQQVLLGMFLVCQAQYIMMKAETCQKDLPAGSEEKGWKMNKDPEMGKLLRDYIVDIDPVKNTRQDLLIRARHKKTGDAWEITHEGKKSLRQSQNTATAL